MARLGHWILILLFLSSSGCSVVMASRQPSRKDLSVLTQGVERPRVIAELGPPLTTTEKDGRKQDIFAFRQGYSSGAKVGRTIFHGVADVFTCGLWEVVGTPVESAANGTPVKVQVAYTKDDRVKQVTCFQGQEKIMEASGQVDKTTEASESKPLGGP